MGIVVNVNSISNAWYNCKLGHLLTPVPPGPGTYYEKVGAANGMRVIIDRYIIGFPEINELEFDDEQSLTWFMLRWA